MLKPMDSFQYLKIVTETITRQSSLYANAHALLYSV